MVAACADLAFAAAAESAARCVVGYEMASSWPSNRAVRPFASDENADAISLQSWIVSVYGLPIGTDAVSAWASGAQIKLAVKTTLNE